MPVAVSFQCCRSQGLPVTCMLLFSDAFACVFIGYLYSQGHLTRAICCRLVRDGDVLQKRLQAPYQINHPEVCAPLCVSILSSTSAPGSQ